MVWLLSLNTFNTSNASSRWIWQASWRARHPLWRVRLHPFASELWQHLIFVQVAGRWTRDEAEKGQFFWRCDGVTYKSFPTVGITYSSTYQVVVQFRVIGRIRQRKKIYMYRGFGGNLSRNTVIDYALSNTDSCHCRRVQPWSAKGVHWPEGRATTAAPEWVLQTCG